MAKKKIILYLLMITAFFAAASTAFAEEEDNRRSEILYRLGILDEAHEYGEYVTRAEAAAISVAMGGFAGGSGSYTYIDVSPENYFAEEIACAQFFQIMVGRSDEIFDPEGGVSAAEFTAVILRAAGYDKLPGAIQEQLCNELRKGSSSLPQDDAKMTLAATKELLLAALELPGYKAEDGNRLVKSDKLLVNMVFNVYKERGTVIAAEEIALKGRAIPGVGATVITGPDGVDYRFVTEGSDFSAYAGWSVDYWYKEENGDRSILCISRRNERSMERELFFDDIDNAETDLSKIQYYDGKKSRTAKIAYDADFIYNGRICYEITKEHLCLDNGKITLLDSEGDGVYDVVKIEHFEYIIAATVNVDENNILDMLTWTNIELDGASDGQDVKIIKNSKGIKLAYVNPGDVIAIARSRNGEAITATVCDSKLNGVIEAFSADERRITIAGETVKTVKGFDFSKLNVGAQVLVGLDPYGYAVGSINFYAEPDINYGYLLAAYLDDAEETTWIKIFTLDGRIEEIPVKEKFKLNEARGANHDLIELAHAPQVVAYKRNVQGEVSGIWSAPAEEPKPEKNPTKPLTLNRIFEGDGMCVYTSFGLAVDYQYNLPQSGLVIDVPLNYDGSVRKDKIQVRQISSKPIPPSSKPAYLAVYNADNMYVSGLCVYAHKNDTQYDENHMTQAFVVEKTELIWDDEQGRQRIRLDGMQSGKKVSYYAYDGIDIDKIRPGDALLLWGYNGEIRKYRRLYSIEGEKYTAGNYDSMAMFGYDNFDSSNIAERIIEIREGLSVSTAAVQSRWTAALGKAQLIYRDAAYPYTVIKVRINGSGEEKSYSTDANTQIYRYSVSRNILEPLSLQSVEFTYDHILLTARYGTVRDLIIYDK